MTNIEFDELFSGATALQKACAKLVPDSVPVKVEMINRLTDALLWLRFCRDMELAHEAKPEIHAVVKQVPRETDVEKH